MGDSTYTASLFLPRSRTEVFAFFADARNLQAITPPWLNFHILTPQPIEMKPGALIDYRLKVHGIPLRWRTLISAWEPPFRFVDEQLKGPYRRWVHEHTFEEVEGGTLCHDRVSYRVPGGKLMERLFVRKDIETIFEYRRNLLLELLSDDRPL